MSVVMWLQFFQGFALLQIKIDWFLNGVWFKVSLSWMLGWGVECGFSVCLCAGGPVRRWDGPASSWSSKEERSWWDSEYEPSSCEREASVCVKVCVSLCVSAGLWDPSWSGGDGRSALHWPDRPSWDRPAAHQPVSSQPPSGHMTACSMMILMYRRCLWWLFLLPSASTWTTVALCPGSCRRPALKVGRSWHTPPKPSTGGCCPTTSKSGETRR